MEGYILFFSPYLEIIYFGIKRFCVCVCVCVCVCDHIHGMCKFQGFKPVLQQYDSAGSLTCLSARELLESDSSSAYEM